MEPFMDVDVLDLTQSIAGPVATQQLGALGANVVKVEPPGGDDFRGNLSGSMFASFNLGDKRSLCVDLRTDDGRDVVQELAAEADVVVESFRPGVLEKFGLDYESVREDNSDVVYCSITGFGHSGPYSDRPAYDPVLQAMSGLISTTGYPDQPPVRTGASVVDCGTGMTAAFAITAGLLERFRTGEGDHLQVSLFEVAVSWMAYWLANYSTTGATPSRSQPGGFAGMSPYGVFEAGDGEQLYMSVVNDEQFRRLCEALDRPALADDERFHESDDRWSNRETLYEVISERFSEYERDGLVERLVEAGVPAGPVNEVDDVAADPHLEERQMLTEVENLTTGEPIRTAGVPIVTTDGRPDAGQRPPTLGEHTRAVLAELGYSSKQIDRMIDAGALRED
jgi:crotonobetainyl-CoA:carnitine CoA-transferase CaiB-like acyl-CoA transferase